MNLLIYKNISSVGRKRKNEQELIDKHFSITGALKNDI